MDDFYSKTRYGWKTEEDIITQNRKHFSELCGALRRKRYSTECPFCGWKKWGLENCPECGEAESCND